MHGFPISRATEALCCSAPPVSSSTLPALIKSVVQNNDQQDDEKDKVFRNKPLVMKRIESEKNKWEMKSDNNQ